MPRHPLESTLLQLGNPAVAEKSKRFHKAGEKETQTLGIRMPKLRALAKQNRNLPLEEIPDLLTSPFHESRLLALLLLVEKYRRTNESEKKTNLHPLS